ncbi:LPS export ABC transporter permease LptG [Cereibacter sphaeroides]|uniref:LPS export ABC transporter permease LptG n=1 Tax=Rhodobacterales TaxID=204455 RepID=UPI000BBF04FF|nr:MULTISPECIES: LPS export ABC transporter permease LptG [Paracoccaceae]MCE6952839.1 LPS export ABC transporter permease LptG [Cereibacter sphaeroides]MCE6962063.1 LPS export ABC transporter permease LptG [Cereibacter sphaeroides]MCE6970838.1 LPS export ABC transporter permease LptG [Cereibacter sphaeroides]MCE6975566.1 LPS export ABC transporter permease LptG [Cereibacter sphaeroides]
MILSRYIARRFARIVLIVFLIFFFLMMLIDVLDQMRRFADAGISLAQAGLLSLLRVPETIYTILPLIVILAAVALFLGLARTSELVVVRAAGRSGLRFLVAPMVVALLIGAFAVAVLNPIVAGTQRQYEEMAGRLARGGERVLSVSKEGLWLRQGAASGQTVIHAARSNADGTRLYAVTFLTFDAEGLPASRLEAEQATLETGYWQLSNAKRWNLTVPNPEAAALAEGHVRVPSDLTREGIRDSFGDPSAIPIWELPAYVAGLERAGFSARQHRVWMQMEFALPFTLAAMVLVAAGFTMRHARFGGTGRMVLFALIAGFGLFFLRSFAQVMGENGQIPILLAAWSPPLIGVMGSLGLLLHLEDG